MYSSIKNKLNGNIFIKDGLLLWGDQLTHFNSHNISTNNSVNEKPLYYYKDCSNIDIIDKPVGQLLLANCTNISINNLQIDNTVVGIEATYSENISIINSDLNLNKKYGVFLHLLSNSTFLNNNITLNLNIGICLQSSYNNSIIGNNLSFNQERGIFIYSSSYNNITCNNINSNLDKGIYLNSVSYENMILRNNIINNGYGIFISIGSIIPNRIYHNNIINNTIQAYDNRETNLWNATYPSGGNYWSDYNGVDLNSTPSQDIPPPDGLGDSPYIIDSDSQDNYPLMFPYGNFTYLENGWNLISIPFIQINTKIDTVLSSINGFWDCIQSYNVSDSFDPWKQNNIFKQPLLNDFNNLDHKRGFWIHITDPNGTLFQYFGTQPTSNQTIQLYEGWNMVGYPSQTSYNRTTGLNNLEFDTEIDCIQWFDAATQTWHFMDSDDNFVPGRGYWMHSKVDTTWEVPL
jgi:parallel beta-helix repeat protein